MQNKLKILHVAETAKGGVETVIRNLLDTRAFDYAFVLPVDQIGRGEFYAQSAYNFRRSGRDLRSVGRMTWQLVRALFSERPDIVHLHSSIAGVVGRLICFCLRPLVNCRVVYCPHAFSFLMESSIVKERFYILVERVLAYTCARVVCVSRHELDVAIECGLPSTRLSLVYNGVATTEPVERQREAGAPIRLLYVGRFDRQKGVDILCDAMTLLPPARFELTVVGGGVHDEANRPSFPQGSTVVDWSGPSELDAIYRAADVLVVPSRWEGFAMVPLEGMALGLPVIASDCTSLPEVVTPGVNGYLFTTGCPKSLANALDKLDPQTLTALGARAWRTVADSFSVGEMRRQTSLVYHQVLGQE